MANEKVKKEDKNAVNDTVAPDPKGKLNTGVDQVNVPLSASNALSPESGIQVASEGGDIEKVVKTDPHDPAKTKVQNEFVDNADNNLTVDDSKSKVATVLDEIFKNHNIDVVQQNIYKKKAGL